MADGHPLSEGSHYAAFVTRSITEVQRGLDLDDTSAKRGVSEVVREVLKLDAADAATRVLCSRFALGGDDAAYLQSGLAVLWSTVAKSQAGDDLTLAPAALYSPDAVGGIRRGLLRAMQAKNEETRVDAADKLRVLTHALRSLLAIPELENFATELDALDDDTTTKVAALCALLTRLRALVNDVSGDNDDLAPSLLRRVDCMTRLLKTQQELAGIKKDAAESAEQAAARLKALEERSRAELDALKAELNELEPTFELVDPEDDEEYWDAEEIAVVVNAWNRYAPKVVKADRRFQKAAARLAALLAVPGTADAPTLQKAEAEVEAAEADLAKKKFVEASIRYNATEAQRQALSPPPPDDDGDEFFETPELGNATASPSLTPKPFTPLPQRKLGPKGTANLEKFRRVAAAEAEKGGGSWWPWLEKQINEPDQPVVDDEEFPYEYDPTYIQDMTARWNELQQPYTFLRVQFDPKKGFNVNSTLPGGPANEGGLAGAGLLFGIPGALPPAAASAHDPHVATALVRGLVGQRGPTEPAATGKDHAPQDALLKYTLPPVAPLAKCLPATRHLLSRLPAPTPREVEAAIDALQGGSGEPTAKRARRTTAAPTSVVHEALAEFGDNFAVISATPAAATDARGGVEMPHQVRWLPTGRRGRAMAEVAVLEHAIARCGQVLASPSVAARPAVAATVRDAAAALKLRQLAPLYGLVEAAAFDDRPHPIGTPVPMVTRPCAVVRGTLSLPTDAGVAPMPAQAATGNVINDQTALRNAMGATTAKTNALRNALRRNGVASNVYVAPPAEALAFVPSPTGATEVDEAYKQAAENLANLFSTAEQTKKREEAAKLELDAAQANVDELVNRNEGNTVPGDAYETELATLADARDAAKSYVENLEEPARKAKAILETKSEVEAAVKAVNDAAEQAVAKAKNEAAAAELSEAEAKNATAKAEREAKAAQIAAIEAQRVRLDALMSANESVYAQDFALPTIRRLVDQILVTSAAVHAEAKGGCDDPIGAFLREEKAAHGGGVDANDRREALWTEFHRHLSISQDRLWIFVRLLSGSIGGDVNEVITMADEASQQATKALQAQRVEVAKRVSDTQAKIVESVVGAMLKESKLAFDARADNLVVMDTEARRDLRDLASGASGRPYFEANVAARNLSEKAEPMKLSALLTNLAAVGAQMQRSLDSTLAQPGLASASLIELSHPSNSYFVSMRTDASTAIRIAHERCNSELAARGVRRRIALWELVEGGCTVLTTRFAEFAGHVLVQNRASTGVSAMYVPHVAIETNAHQARVALARLTNAAEVYAARVPPPSFGGGAQTAADVKAARRDAMDHGGRIKEHDVGLGTSRGNPRTGHGHLYRAQSASGWWVR
jgi:hypothetical protein